MSSKSPPHCRHWNAPSRTTFLIARPPPYDLDDGSAGTGGASGAEKNPSAVMPIACTPAPAPFPRAVPLPPSAIEPPEDVPNPLKDTVPIKEDPAELLADIPSGEVEASA